MRFHRPQRPEFPQKLSSVIQKSARCLDLKPQVGSVNIKGTCPKHCQHVWFDSRRANARFRVSYCCAINTKMTDYKAQRDSSIPGWCQWNNGIMPQVKIIWAEWLVCAKSQMSDTSRWSSDLSVAQECNQQAMSVFGSQNWVNKCTEERGKKSGGEEEAQNEEVWVDDGNYKKRTPASSPAERWRWRITSIVNILIHPLFHLDLMMINDSSHGTLTHHTEMIEQWKRKERERSLSALIGKYWLQNNEQGCEYHVIIKKPGNGPQKPGSAIPSLKRRALES